MLSKKEFLKKYRISNTIFRKSGLRWDELEIISNDYKSKIPDYLPTCKGISERLNLSNKVHSIKFRLKDTEHLIEKIIRKNCDEPTRNINFTNYTEEITDLIGVRALHLFKDEWLDIHNYIKKTWTLKEKPIVNIRQGDSENYRKAFEENDCIINEHKYGYRSIHYVVQCNPTKEKYYAEIQVRTIFEEGWSEIDHKIRYPYETDNAILNQFLIIFNRLAGSSDEMGSFIKLLKFELAEREFKSEGKIEELSRTIDELKNKIKKLKLSKPDLDSIYTSLNTITNINVDISNLIEPFDDQSFLDSIKIIKNLEFPDISNYYIGINDIPRITPPIILDSDVNDVTKKDEPKDDEIEDDESDGEDDDKENKDDDENK